MTDVELRPELAQFAGIMEQILEENDHKGDWRDCNLSYLITRLGVEKSELDNAVRDYLFRFNIRPGIPQSYKKQVLENRQEARTRAVKCAVDTANYAMFIAMNLLAEQEKETQGGGV